MVAPLKILSAERRFVSHFPFGISGKYRGKAAHAHEQPSACAAARSISVNFRHAKRGTLPGTSFCVVGTVRLELMTSCMSSMRSNQLSYAPVQALL